MKSNKINYRVFKKALKIFSKKQQINCKAFCCTCLGEAIWGLSDIEKFFYTLFGYSVNYEDYVNYFSGIMTTIGVQNEFRPLGWWRYSKESFDYNSRFIALKLAELTSREKFTLT